MDTRTRTIGLWISIFPDDESHYISKKFEVNEENGAAFTICAERFFKDDPACGTSVIIPSKGSEVSLFPLDHERKISFVCMASSANSDERGDEVNMKISQPLLRERDVDLTQFSHEDIVRLLGTMGWK